MQITITHSQLERVAALLGAAAQYETNSAELLTLNPEVRDYEKRYAHDFGRLEGIMDVLRVLRIQTKLGVNNEGCSVATVTIPGFMPVSR